MIVQQYRVELRTVHGSTKTIDVMALSHGRAKARAERQTGLLVLSTELID